MNITSMSDDEVRELIASNIKNEEELRNICKYYDTDERIKGIIREFYCDFETKHDIQGVIPPVSTDIKFGTNIDSLPDWKPLKASYVEYVNDWKMNHPTVSLCDAVEIMTYVDCNLDLTAKNRIGSATVTIFALAVVLKSLGKQVVLDKMPRLFTILNKCIKTLPDEHQNIRDGMFKMFGKLIVEQDAQDLVYCMEESDKDRLHFPKPKNTSGEKLGIISKITEDFKVTIS